MQTHARTHLHAYMCIHTYICLHKHASTCIYIHMHARMCTYVHVYMYVHMNGCVYIHKHTCKWSYIFIINLIDWILEYFVCEVVKKCKFDLVKLWFVYQFWCKALRLFTFIINASLSLGFVVCILIKRQR